MWVVGCIESDGKDLAAHRTGTQTGGPCSQRGL